VLCKVGIDSPIALLVGIGESRTLDWSRNSAVVQLVTMSMEAHFDIAKAFAPGQLSKSHGEKLVPTSKSANL